ncbi:MAG: DUF1730 domain-containing protein [Lentisphaerae bacterium]|nr:DUF1730 domain-containing protein [Lentisphaerota bacterium]
MEYLFRHAAMKDDLHVTLPSARSVIVVTFRNKWGHPDAAHPFPVPAPGAPVGYISAYAKERDYHHVGQELLSGLAAELVSLSGRDVGWAIGVDTKPVYERLLALTGGLGVQGGNDLLRTPELNVRVFIGCLFVDCRLPEVIRTPKMLFPCETCRACVKRCPTGALEFGKPIDARKCISYLTIEKRTVLDREDGAKIEDWLFGCDWCTTVCPVGDAAETRIPVDLEWLLKTPAARVRKILEGTATSYAGVTQLRKTAVVLLKKNPSPQAAALLAWVRDHSGSEVVRAQLMAW